MLDTTSLLFLHVNYVFLMLIARNLHKKSSEVSTKRGSTPASLSFKGRATKPTMVKWSIIHCFAFFLKLPVSCFPDTHTVSSAFFTNRLELKCKVILNFIPSIDIVVLDKLLFFFFFKDVPSARLMNWLIY